MRIIFVDIDGTLVDCKRGMHQPSVQTINAIKKLQSNGDLVLIVSGRPKCLLDTHIIELGVDGFILANGGYIEYHNEVVAENALSEIAVQRIIAYANKANCPFYLETSKHVYSQLLDSDIHHDYFDDWKVDQALAPYDGLKRSYTAAMMALNHNEQVLKECFEELSDVLDLTRQGELYAYDINVKGLNKGTGIKQFLAYLNTENLETYAFGDGQNDISMMCTVDHAIGMGNACQELRPYCETITEDVLEDGFAKGLARYQVIQFLMYNN